MKDKKKLKRLSAESDVGDAGKQLKCNIDVYMLRTGSLITYFGWLLPEELDVLSTPVGEAALQNLLSALEPPSPRNPILELTREMTWC